MLEKYLRLYWHQGESTLFTAQNPFSLKVTRLSYCTVYENWSRVIQQSPELKSFRLHKLRHTLATERVGLMGIEALRALLEHSNIQTTLRYQKVTSIRAEEVVKKALLSLTKTDLLKGSTGSELKRLQSRLNFNFKS